jgi:hypothetical protein
LVSSVLLSHAFSGELKAVGVVNEAIENCIAQGGITDDIVPKLYGDLAGDDGRSAPVAIVEDLEQIASFGRIKNRQTPIIQDQQLNAAERFEQAAVTAVAACEGECFEQSRDTMVLD